LYYLLRIIEKVLIIYFLIYFVIDLLLYFYALFTFWRKKQDSKTEPTEYARHAISLIVPSYNEAVSIVDCIHMLLQVDYPDFELIVVNDGSKDNTRDVILEAFDFTKSNNKGHNHLVTKPVIATYNAGSNLIFIDKENGGKADALNVGINMSTKDYVCTIDADSILDQQALKKVITPFIQNPNTIVSGGQLAAANDVKIVDDKVVSAKVPGNIWVHWQVIEYIKSFMISRMGLGKVGALLIMSGAFSLYRKSDLLKIGGFLTAINKHPYIASSIGLGHKTVCEDMEIVVRLWRYVKDQKRRAYATFLPQPICWTEVPENRKSLFKQRSRWHQGLGETLKIHRQIILEPKYGIIGLLAMPYYLFFEFISPLIKAFTIFFLVLASYYHLLNLGWVVLLIISVTLTTAIILTSITAIIENWSLRQNSAAREALRYKNFIDWIKLIFSGIVAEFSYSFFKVAAQINGFFSFLKKKSAWNKFERKGLVR